MQKVICFAAVACLAFAAPSPVISKRGTNEIMYAYGLNITGLPIFMDNQLAYIGNLSFMSTPIWAQTASQVTWTTTSSDTTVPWTVTKAGSNDTGLYDFYINTATGSFAQAGFYSNASDGVLDVDLATTGFTYMGTEVAFAASESDYQEKFWARTTNATGVWELMWNVDGTLEADSVPIVLKSFAPPASSLVGFMAACDGEC